MSDEPKISARYRELPREEPPRHLDEAILAAARRAAEVRPAPLVAPSGRTRWYFPLAAAAVIVLAVAVTVHVERERPDPEMVASSPTAPREEPRVMEAPPAAVPAPTPAPAPAPPPARKAEPRPKAEQPAAKDFVPDPQPQAVPAPTAPPAVADTTAQARVEEERKVAAEARVQARPEAPAAAKAMRRAPEERRREVSGLGGAPAYRSPEQWLQGIADLRRQGRHDEADKALGEFRRAYPDYRIPEAMLERVERAR